MSGEEEMTLPIASAAPATRGRGDVPERFGRFVVLDRVGEGGMGVVYRARDPALGRDVAIKIVAPTRGDAESRERLLREAQALGRVAHPNVVSVYEVGAHEGMLFIAMELVPGETLGHWLRKEERTYVDILRKYIQAGRGLAAAHRAGVLHRDFKPANVVVAEDGRARVIDFGVARSAHIGSSVSPEQTTSERETSSAPAPSDPSTPTLDSLSSPLTQFGDLVGTPTYMSPEHFTGKVSGASDQWSLCVALYRSLFSGSPFEGENLELLRVAIVTDDPRAPNRGDVPAPIVDAIMRGLRRDPAERWPSVDALADALELALRTEPTSDSVRFRRYRRIAAVALSAVAVSIEVFRNHRNDAIALNLREHVIYSLAAEGSPRFGAFSWGVTSSA